MIALALVLGAFAITSAVVLVYICSAVKHGIAQKYGHCTM